MSDIQKTSFYLRQYKLQGIEVDFEYLQTLIAKTNSEAESNYKKLISPVMSKSLYIKHWIYSSITRDISKKGLQHIQPFDFQRSATFLEIYPPELRATYQKKIWGVASKERQSVWDSLDIPYQKIESAFRGLVSQRNDIVSKKNHKSSLDYYLSLYNISPKDYRCFNKNIEKVLDVCNKRLGNLHSVIPDNFNSEFNNPCYICLLNDFPFNNLKEVENYIYKNNDLLKKHHERIDIIFGNNSSTTYLKETDRFNIQIDKNANLRHQSVDLIHEFSHILDRLTLFKKDILLEEKGIYYDENKTLRIEMEFLKQISISLYIAILGEFLKVFHRILFEIDLYQNPNQNLSQKYAQIFNKCYHRAKQLKNKSYILDNLIMENPFATLPHAIAQSEVVCEL